MHDRRCEVTFVTDGDTVKVYSDEDRRKYEELDLRLFGVFAPDKKDAGYVETTEYVKEWLAEHDDGEPWPYYYIMIRNRKDTREETTFGRYVAMFFSRDGDCLNTAVSAYVTEKGYPRGIGG